jgi:Flp pilus assembly protein TadB
MTACPLCGAAWADGETTCVCGYDVLLVESVEQDRKSWRVARNVFGAMAAIGITLSVLVPSLGVAAGVAVIGVVGGVWSAKNVRSSNRRLREVATPKALPQARVRQLPAPKPS